MPETYTVKKKKSFSDTLEILALSCFRIPYYFGFLSNFVCFWFTMVFSYISYCSFPIPSTLSKEQGINRIMRVQPFSWYKWHMISHSVHLQHFSFLFFPKLGAIALFLLEKVYWLAYWTEWKVQKNLCMYGYMICESDESSSMEKRLFFSVRVLGQLDIHEEKGF